VRFSHLLQKGLPGATVGVALVDCGACGSPLLWNHFPLPIPPNTDATRPATARWAAVVLGGRLCPSLPACVLSL
ncbi:hypothetical protein P7K49_024732, partial [Saguinus oedipus]